MSSIPQNIERFSAGDLYLNRQTNSMKRSELYRDLNARGLPSAYKGRALAGIESGRNFSGMTVAATVLGALLFTAAFAMATKGFQDFSAKNLVPCMGGAYGITGAIVIAGTAAGVTLEIQRRKKMNEEVDQGEAEKEITQIRAALQKDATRLANSSKSLKQESDKCGDEAEGLERLLDAIVEPD